MPRHILLMAHGMGFHGDQWIAGEDGPADTLKRVSKRYSYFKTTPLEELVEFVPLSYDSVFQTIVTQWQTNATAIAALPGNTLGGATAWLRNAGSTEHNFWWSHSADVALYRCFPTYREAVRSHVMKSVTAALRRADGADVSVLAHSLGTSVLHDTLHLLGTQQSLGGKPNAFRATAFRFANVIMVANVSRLLQTSDRQMSPVYRSVVRPGPSGDPASYCLRYLNFRHEADPVPFPRMFEPAGWDKARYTSEIIRHYWQANVHDVGHYLINPRVHIPILRALTEDIAVTHEEEIYAVNPDHFPQIAGSFAFVSKVTQLVERLEELKKQLGEDPDNGVLTRVLTEYAVAISEAA